MAAGIARPAIGWRSIMGTRPTLRNRKRRSRCDRLFSIPTARDYAAFLRRPPLRLARPAGRPTRFLRPPAALRTPFLRPTAFFLRPPAFLRPAVFLRPPAFLRPAAFLRPPAFLRPAAFFLRPPTFLRPAGRPTFFLRPVVFLRPPAAAALRPAFLRRALRRGFCSFSIVPPFIMMSESIHSSSSPGGTKMYRYVDSALIGALCRL